MEELQAGEAAPAAQPKTQAQSPSIGRIVIYCLTDGDADGIQLQRNRIPGRVFNSASAGDYLPMIIVRVWPGEYGPDVPGVNGQVFLDGGDTLWVTSVGEGDEPGQWHWPQRQ